MLVTRCPTFESNFVISTLRDGESQTTFASQSTVRSRLRQPKPIFNITREDQEALENVDWDDDADLHATANNAEIAVNRPNGSGKNDVAARGSSTESYIELVQRAKRKKGGTNGVTGAKVNEDRMESDDDNYVVPNSPQPPPLRRTVLQRCYDSTFHKSGESYGTVLVANSDPESDNDMDVR